MNRKKMEKQRNEATVKLINAITRITNLLFINQLIIIILN